MTKTGQDPMTAAPAVVLVTGPSGAGRSTAIRALEDLGYEVIDNLPLSLLPRLLEGPPPTRPLALGVDVRNRDFSTSALIDTIDRLTGKGKLTAQVLYMDAAEEELVRRYSETRRRHPLAPAGSPLQGIAAERELLIPIRARADVLIDTTGLSPHDAKAEVEKWFETGDGRKLGVTLHSFSYKRGLPRGMDIIMDCRFLQNPHWVETLRDLDGRDPDVAKYVAADPRFPAFFDQVKGLADLLLPAHRDEGKAHLSIGFGCTGGKHRSVAMTEKLAEALAQDGWHVSKRHRELERRAAEGIKENAV
ncbi:RNase adapter RapZ [Roseobacter sp. CCS2]|uniref:RNase adapter RapZ n=1 Tax=Roseobacter sp. CCS2 TaxID=391593 RepID=UPI0000F3E332|nr:RNase adapter RapZ [Roseobacter sp. CCS2]EBA12156.1 hypothetical protein RCCS2_12704 [Roseobacter sp. CCS2]